MSRCHVCLHPALPLSFLCVIPASASKEWKLGLYLKGRAGADTVGRALASEHVWVSVLLVFNVCETAGPSKMRRLGKEAEEEGGSIAFTLAHTVQPQKAKKVSRSAVWYKPGHSDNSSNWPGLVSECP